MKAILVLDNILGGVPESCADCPLEYDNLCCILVENLYRKREDGCPLRPLPERKEEMDYLAAGYNKCLDDILEGE